MLFRSVLVRPRYAQGRTDVVTGYSVALRPAKGERAIWFGGGRLARDLSLTRLRENWPDTPQSATEAVAEWNRAATKRPPSLQTEPGETPSWSQVGADLDRLTRRLSATPLDSPEWVNIARHTAGALSALARSTETTPGPLTSAARTLSRVGQTRRQPSAVPGSHPALTGLAILASATKSSSLNQAMMWMQLTRIATLVVQSHALANQTRLARDVRETTIATLSKLATTHTVTQAVTATQKQVVNTTSSTGDDAARRRRIALGGGAPQRTSTTPPSPTVRPPSRDHDHER